MEFEKKEKQSDNLRTRTILFVYEMKDNWLGIAKKKKIREEKTEYQETARYRAY